LSEFNNMTVVAACGVMASVYSHGDLSFYETEWGISGRTSQSSKSQRAADIARIATMEDLQVMTIGGRTSLARAIIEMAIDVPELQRKGRDWERLIAGLRFDGFEVFETRTPIPGRESYHSNNMTIERSLRRIYPGDIPALDFREAESEIVGLLRRRHLTASLGHLEQALHNFSQGNWPAANSQLRTFVESALYEMAARLGYTGNHAVRDVLNFMGGLSTPMVRADYNEWDANDNKKQFLTGFWARLHPHGSHPGLSEQDDSTFRLHIVLVTMRLLLRRFDQLAVI
jgi:hypothetical protein